MLPDMVNASKHQIQCVFCFKLQFQFNINLGLINCNLHFNAGHFFCEHGCFLAPFYFLVCYSACFIIVEASSVLDFESFIYIISNALKVALFRVLRLLVSILLITLPSLLGQVLRTGMMHVIFDIEVIIDNRQCCWFHTVSIQ